MVIIQLLANAVRLRKIRNYGLSAVLNGAFVGGALIAAPAFAQSPATAVQTLRLGIGLPAESVQGQAVMDFASRVEKYTEGAIRIELLAGGKAGNDIAMVKALQVGELEMTAPDSSTLASLEKGFSAINYPFTFLNEVEADTILDGPWGQRLLDNLEKHGIHGLAYWENGFRQMTNSRKPMSKALDFVGVRMRTMQNPLLVDSFSRLGFDAVPMSFNKVYGALQTQEVDGQENPLPTILNSKFYEVQKYLTLSRHVYSAHTLLIAKKRWDSLKPAHQEAIQRAVIESRGVERKLSRDGSDLALTELKAKGMEVSTIPKADAERIRNRLREVFDKYNRDIGIETMIELYVALGKMRTASDTSRVPDASKAVAPKAAAPQN
jgi:TRAP-type transport system periplasmic protein